jgi:thiamine transport system ATP-binding protein
MDMCFDLEVPAGAFLAIIGPSGSGKSTLLSLVAGFDQASSGTILIGPSDVTRLPPPDRPVTMLFQDHNLFSHLDAETNVTLGLSPRLRPTPDEQARARAALARVGLAGFGRRLPGELSGGERQRVALARALARDRPVLLLDEPFAALGPALRRQMIALLMDLHRETGATVLLVTHQPEDARACASLTAFLESGRIRAVRPTAKLFAANDVPGLRDYLG